MSYVQKDWLTEELSYVRMNWLAEKLRYVRKELRTERVTGVIRRSYVRKIYVHSYVQNRWVRTEHWETYEALLCADKMKYVRKHCYMQKKWVTWGRIDLREKWVTYGWIDLLKNRVTHGKLRTEKVSYGSYVRRSSWERRIYVHTIM